MKIRTLFPLTLGLLVLAGQAAAAAPAALAERVRAFVDASNRQDVAAMLAATREDVRWVAIEGDVAQLEVVGHTDLRSWLQGYYASTREARSELGEVSVDGAYATAFETTSWANADGTRAVQTALSVYRFDDAGLIERVWYFPAYAAPAGAAATAPAAAAR
jgi:hypothetical protein